MSATHTRLTSSSAKCNRVRSRYAAETLNFLLHLAFPHFLLLMIGQVSRRPALVVKSDQGASHSCTCCFQSV